jgi:hypothetical protein
MTQHESKSMIALLWQVLCQKAGSWELLFAPDSVYTVAIFHRHADPYRFSSACRCPAFSFTFFSSAWRCPVIETNLSGTGSALSSTVKFLLGRGNCSLCVGQNHCREG